MKIVYDAEAVEAMLNLWGDWVTRSSHGGGCTTVLGRLIRDRGLLPSGTKHMDNEIYMPPAVELVERALCQMLQGDKRDVMMAQALIIRYMERWIVRGEDRARELSVRMNERISLRAYEDLLAQGRVMIRGYLMGLDSPRGLSYKVA